ncbi:MAG: VPS10 domain-containing protein, partial [Gemmatimonadales bacterium]
MLALPLLGSVPRTAAGQAADQPVDTSAFAALKWRNIGPFRSGRSVAVAGSLARPNEYYAGTTGGGVMKTTNGGYTWEPVTDKYFGGTVGGVAIYQPNPDIVYVGTGESTLRGNTSYGDGVYKTTDGGATWTHLGLRDTRHIAGVIVHPWNPDIVYVAALGHAYGPNPERGVFRSKDGGKTWQKILFRSDSAGVTDLVMDPTDPAVLYAATWQMVRKPWDIVSGGPGSALYKTTDGGDHWTELTHNSGLPKGTLGNIGIAVSPANPRRVWAIIEADSSGLYRSEDAGATWQRINKRRNIHWRPFYFSRVFADPVDTNTVYLPNGVLYRSTDGGKRFTEVRPYNDLWDSHVLWIAPDNRDRMIVGADQGARISLNRGANWSTTGYATGQFYHISATNHFPYRVCGSQQDNYSSCGPSRSDNLFDITQWYYAGGGEAGVIVGDPARPDLIYATGGGNTRYDRSTGLFARIDPWWEPPALPKDTKHRWNWTTPIAISPHDSRVVYIGSNMLFRSTDGGATWSIISPDLTHHDPGTLIVAGGPITREATGAETYATIFTIAESP